MNGWEKEVYQQHVRENIVSQEFLHSNYWPQMIAEKAKKKSPKRNTQI